MVDFTIEGYGTAVQWMSEGCFQPYDLYDYTLCLVQTVQYVVSKYANYNFCLQTFIT